mmetsp:Transcript_31536/g.84188  ORF Transcript_31536/g.84188 Transcript_31536/m.84188 type:complete len:538 (-) Transcript_31536:1304-2917(-)
MAPPARISLQNDFAARTADTSPPNHFDSGRWTARACFSRRSRFEMALHICQRNRLATASAAWPAGASPLSRETATRVLFGSCFWESLSTRSVETCGGWTLWWNLGSGAPAASKVWRTTDFQRGIGSAPGGFPDRHATRHCLCHQLRPPTRGPAATTAAVPRDADRIATTPPCPPLHAHTKASDEVPPEPTVSAEWQSAPLRNQSCCCRGWTSSHPPSRGLPPWHPSPLGDGRSPIAGWPRSAATCPVPPASSDASSRPPLSSAQARHRLAAALRSHCRSHLNGSSRCRSATAPPASNAAPGARASRPVQGQARSCEASAPRSEAPATFFVVQRCALPRRWHQTTPLPRNATSRPPLATSGSRNEILQGSKGVPRSCPQQSEGPLEAWQHLTLQPPAPVDDSRPWLRSAHAVGRTPSAAADTPERDSTNQPLPTQRAVWCGCTWRQCSQDLRSRSLRIASTHQTALRKHPPPKRGTPGPSSSSLTTLKGLRTRLAPDLPRVPEWARSPCGLPRTPHRAPASARAETGRRLASAAEPKV